MRLKDKIAIVTGGGSGFGEGIVRKFIAEGTRVVVADRDQAAAERVAGAFDGKAVAAVADISNESGFAAVVQKALRDFGGLDILVNNAGVGHTPQLLETVTDDMFDRIANVNMKSIYYMQRSSCRTSSSRNMASCSMAAPPAASVRDRTLPGTMPRKDNHGDALRAVELAPFIRVNAINPAAGNAASEDLHGAGHARDPRQIPVDSIGRFPAPEDMGNAALPVLRRASMITGSPVEVRRASDGDLTARSPPAFAAL